MAQNLIQRVRKDFSLQAMLFAIFLLLAFPFVFGFPLKILSWDTFGYYMYLPQLFIEGDLKMQDLTHVYDILWEYNETNVLYHLHPLENGNHINQYSSGVAVLHLPFFGAAHAYAHIFGYQADGYSSPYVWAFLIGNYFYISLGIIMFRKAMLELFSKNITGILILVICLGTNFLAMNTTSLGITHIYLFPCYAFLLLYTIRWHKDHQPKHLVYIGAILGLMIIIRPLDGMAILVPLLWDMSSLRLIKQKLGLLYKQRKHLILATIAALLVCSIQMAYWKHVSGDFISYSYKNPEEGMYLDQPHLLEFLFSFRKGWFLYTPLAAVAFIGFAISNKSRKSWFLPLILFFLLTIYISSCWSTWWYASSFSQRPMMQSLPLLAIPLGSVILWISKRTWTLYAFSTIIVLLTALNILQSYQYCMGIINTDRMTKEYYFKVFGKPNGDPEAMNLLLPNRDTFTFAQDSVKESSNFILDPDTEIAVFSEHPYGTVVSMIYEDFSESYYAWIDVQMDVYIPNESDSTQIYCACSMHENGRQYGWLNHYATDAEESAKDKWFHWRFQYLTPDIRHSQDTLKIIPWSGGQPFSYKNFEVTTWTPLRYER